MYSVADYGAMIADRPRTGAFARALAAAVKPGAVVLDIGTGTGIFALLACRFGASRVYALEPADVIDVARQIAAVNGCADRIEFIQALSTKVTLPQPADVIVSDIGGVLPWFRDHLPCIIDARQRLLAPGGVLIPRRDVAWAAIVEAPRLYDNHTGPWADNEYGLDMTAARDIVVNTWTKTRTSSEQLLTDVRRWAAIDYARVSAADVCGEPQWTVQRTGLAHGVAVGFDRVVADGVEICTAPDAAEDTRPLDIYGNMFFPWPQAVAVVPGDRVSVAFDARLIGGDYVWNWRTRVETSAGTSVKAAFAQSTFYGSPLALSSIHRRAAGHVPSLNDYGRAARVVLERMGQGIALGAIAGELTESFPGEFGLPGDALAFVSYLSRQFAD
jgi:protein arginine N-methyltransferase 1